MKKLFTICIGSMALAWGAFAQTPTMTPMATPGAPSSPTSAVPTASMATATATAAASMTPALSASPTASERDSLAERIHKKIDAKVGKKRGGVHIQVDGDDDEGVSDHTRVSREDIPEMVIPLVGMIMLILFGAPVLAMALLLYFGFSKTRMMHRTVRMMVEKGQPVPEALLNPPPYVRKRSDMRRGVILLMIGVGVLVFLGAASDWDGGAWALGLIPLLIGVGYLLVWMLERKPDGQPKADNPPPLP